MKPILEWIEEYLITPPRRTWYGVYRGGQGGCAIYLLDVYGTDDSKAGINKQIKPLQGRLKRSPEEIETTLKRYRLLTCEAAVSPRPRRGTRADSRRTTL